MSKIKIRVLRYETVLDLLEDGPVNFSEIVENLSNQYPEKHISDVVLKMKDKGYVDFLGLTVEKKKGLFYNEL
jgi:hypothetical protein